MIQPPSPHHRFISVGTRLAIAIVAVLAVAAGIISSRLSALERETLLSAKETTADMVNRLFAGAIVAPVVFKDDTGIKESVANLARNEDVLGIGIWLVEEGKIQGQLGVFARPGQPTLEPPSILDDKVHALRTANAVVVDSPITDPTGSKVAVSRVVFSLARENAQADATGRRVLMGSAALALALSLVLLLAVRGLIVLPLARLVEASRRLAAGEVARSGIDTGDELGQLGTAFDAMSDAIRQREDRINARNRDMRFVLDNVEQGFITLDSEGRVGPERSRIVDDWLGTPAPSSTLWDWVRATDDDWARWFKLGFDAVIEDMLPLEVTVDQLPRRMHCGKRVLEAAYRPFLQDGQLEKLILVLSDVTDAVQREQAEIRQKELMAIFQRVLSDRSGFDEFLREARSLVKRIGDFNSSDQAALRRDIHTLKGNTTIYSLTSVSTYCHELEQQLKDSGRPITVPQKSRLHACWAEVERMAAGFAIAESSGRRTIEDAEIAELIGLARHRVDVREIAALVASWRHDPASRRLERLAITIRDLARRLGKGDVDVELRTTSLRTAAAVWGGFWSNFTHVLRNVVDHGIEPLEVRRAAGKSDVAHVFMSFEPIGGCAVLTISDDGQGIDWDAIAKKAQAAGLPHSSPEDLLSALFADGVSSRDSISEISGRGVGMGAVREATLELGGHIEVESEKGQGTTFRFIFPLSALWPAERWSSVPPPAINVN